MSQNYVADARTVSSHGPRRIFRSADVAGKVHGGSDHVGERGTGLGQRQLDPGEDLAGLCLRGVADSSEVVPDTKIWLPIFTAREKPRLGSRGDPEEML